MDNSIEDKIKKLAAEKGRSKFFEFSIYPGWYQLILDLDKELSSIYPYKIAQCKSKFGGLRFYIDPLDCDKETYIKVNTTIHKYENKSFTVCELCGKEGKNQKINDWYYTVCPEHAEEIRNK